MPLNRDRIQHGNWLNGRLGGRGHLVEFAAGDAFHQFHDSLARTLMKDDVRRFLE